MNGNDAHDSRSDEVKPGAAGPNRAPVLMGILSIVAIALGVRIPLAAGPGFLPDQHQFLLWAYLAADHGFPSVYETYEAAGRTRRWCNYPPAYVYVLRGCAELYPWLTGQPLDIAAIRAMSLGEDSREYRLGYILFKTPAMLADALTAACLFVFIRRRASARLAGAVAVAYAVLPPVLHNSAVWGQVDSIHTLLMLLSVEAASRRRWLPMVAAASLGVLFKAQALLLLPLWLVALIDPGERSLVAAGRQCLARGATGLLVFAAFAAIMTAPFYPHWRGAYDAIFGAVGHYPYVHLNGFSLWFLLNPLSDVGQTFAPYVRDDGPTWLIATPRLLGMLALLGVWVMVAVRLYRSSRTRADFAWAARVLPLAFFLLPTQIHERYLFPAIALWAWGMRGVWWDWAGWLLVALCHQLNLSWVYPGPHGSALRDAAEWFFSGAGGAAVGIASALVVAAILLITLGSPFWPGPTSREGATART